MLNHSRKKKVVLVIVLFLIAVFLFYLYNEAGKSRTSISMFFEIEEKEHHIEPGKYMKMWVIGSNSNDSNPNKERYKVMIKDSRIYNLLEEGNEYAVLIHGVKKRNQSEYIFTFGQLGLVDGTYLSGEGKIEQ